MVTKTNDLKNYGIESDLRYTNMSNHDRESRSMRMRS